MPGPWEKYQNQQESGPWEKYGGQITQAAAAEQPPSAGSRFMSNLSESFGLPAHPLDAAVAEAKDFAAHPVDSIVRAGKQVARLPIDMLQANAATAQKGFDEWKQGQYGPAVADIAYSAIPVFGPTMSKAGEQLKTGDVAGGAGTMAGLGVQAALMTPAGRAAAGKVTTAAKEAPRTVANAGRGALSAKMAEVPAGEQFSRAEVLDAARKNGVNLDLADATDSKVARTIKKANQFSLGGSTTYEKNAAANRGALEQWGQRLLDDTADENLSREATGTIVKNRLLAKQSDLADAAGQYFQQVDKNLGGLKPDLNAKLESGTSVRQMAKDIIAENNGYYEQFPEMKPKKAWTIVENIAEGKGDTWGNLQKLRSDIMKEVQSPDLVGSRAEGWLKHIEGGISEALDRSAQNLSPLDAELYQKGNARWRVMKETFDNPQHPFYHIARALDGNTAGDMASRLKPEYIRQLKDALEERNFSTFQRDQIARLLSPAEGQPFSFDRLNQRITRADIPRLMEIFGADKAKELSALGKVAQKVTADSNPSGSARYGYPAAEAGAIMGSVVTGNPAPALVPFAEYGMSRVLNSPRVVDYLTRKPADVLNQPPTSFRAPLPPPKAEMRKSQGGFVSVDKSRPLIQALQQKPGDVTMQGVMGKASDPTPAGAAIKPSSDGVYRLPLVRGISEHPNDWGIAGHGSYWSNSEQLANVYAGKAGKVVHETVELKNPLIVSESELSSLHKQVTGGRVTGFNQSQSAKFDEWLRAQGHDGVVIYDPEIPGRYEVSKLSAGPDRKSSR